MTYFVVDRWADGVEIRPLTQMTGSAEFNEVYFSGVRVPDDNRVGDVNDGWRCARTTLMNERNTIAGLTLAWVTGEGRIRHIGDPPAGAQLVEPTVEDGYLLLAGRDAHDNAETLAS